MRLIDAGKLILYLNDWAFGIAPSEYDDNETKKYTVQDLRVEIYKTLNDCMQTIDEQPTIDAKQVKHGRWKRTDDEPLENAAIYECSECKAPVWIYSGDTGWHYCPNCGAKMDEVTE